MNWKWKRKWLLSLAITFSMVFSTVGAAATGLDTPTGTSNIESGTGQISAATDSGSGTDSGSSDGFDLDSGHGTSPGSGDAAVPGSGDTTNPDSGDGTDTGSGDTTDPDSCDGADTGSDDGTNPDSGNGTDSDSDDETNADSGNGADTGSDDGTNPDSGNGTDSDSDDGTNADSGDGADSDSGDGTDSDSDNETNADSGNGADSDSGDGTDSGSDDETNADSGNGADTDTGDTTNPDSGDGADSDSDSGDGTNPDSGDGTDTDSDSGDATNPDSGDEADTDSDTEDATNPDSGDTMNPAPGDETDSDSGDTASPAPGDEEIPNPQEPMDPENPDNKPSVDLIPELPDHNWSTEWSYDEIYHWHECGDEDCPVTDDCEKDGYGEHSYGIDNACTICGYVEPVNPLARASVIPTYEEAYDAMIGLKDKEPYKEGTEWTNFTPYGSKGPLGDSYVWKGGRIYGANRGVGCSAFAFILSDEAFGYLPARAIEHGKFTFEDVKVGDILRVNNNSHSVIVLKKSPGGVIIAEANFKKTVHWGRAMSKSEVLAADHIITRYPEGYSEEDTGDEELAQDGKAGSLDWLLTSGGVLTISGNGVIPNYSTSSPAPWYQYKSDIHTVIIEDGVTGIGDYAFYESGVLSIHIPDSVEKIGANAFKGSGLISVTIPGSVGEIGSNAFQDCTNLTSVTVSEGVETIGNEAFRGCTSLEYIDFPTSITSIGAGAFMSCEKMARVRFMPGSGTVTLGDNLFSQCWYLTDVTLPQTADRISAGMFQSCIALPTLYIPASVTKIGENPFTSCNFLKYIYFGGSEAAWKRMMTPYLEASLKSTGTTVICNAEFNDPFAQDPNDPGDLLPDGDETDPPTPDDGDGDETDPPGPGDDDNPGSGDGDTAHKHNWSQTWSQNSTAHWHECGNKGCPITSDRDKDGYGRHSYGGWIIDVNATASQSGSRHRDCSVCGYRQTERIPATGSSGGSDDSSGSSGDNSGSSSDSSGSSGSSGDNSGSSDSSDTGASTTVEQLPDGSSVATTTRTDGTVTRVTTSASGQVTTQVNLSPSAVTTAQQNGKAVSLPVPAVPVTWDVTAAPAITVHSGSEKVTVEIPALSPTAGTVAVIVHGDGSTQVIPSSAVTGTGVVAVLPNGATVKIVDNSKSYGDVPAENQFADAVAFVSARDLINGATETTFAPDAPMTSAALMTALARLDGVPTEGGAAWYSKAMEWAAARGIASGAGPDSSMSGEELVTTLWTYMGSPAVPELTMGSAASGNTRTAMGWAAKNGIVGGFPPGTLNLQGQISRGQAARIIMNLVNHLY